jgi:predicted nucleic acid-binding protein
MKRSRHKRLLIFFSRSGHLDLLQAFANEVWVPEPVAKEILQRGAQDTTAKAIEYTAWLDIRPAPPLPQRVLEWRLSPGECSWQLCHGRSGASVLGRPGS